MKITKSNRMELLTQYIAQFYGEGSVIDSWVLQEVDDDHGSIGDIMCNISSINAGKVNALIDAHKFREWVHAIDKFVVEGSNNVIIITDKGTIEVDWESRQVKFN